MPSTGDLCLSTLHNTEGNALPSRGKRQHQVQPRARAAPSAAARAAPSADTKERAPPARRRPCQAEASYLNSHTKRTASADASPISFTTLLVYANANAGLGYAAKSQQRKQKMRTAKPERQLDTRYEEMSRINHSFPIMRWTWRWTTGSELQGHFSDLRLRSS